MLVRRVWPSRPSFDDPLTGFDQLRREMARLLDEAPGGEAGQVGAGVFPPLNVTQDEENIYVRAEVPGVKPDELSISALHNRVVLSGERKIPEEQARVSYHRKERAEGSFSRTVTLPMPIDAERVDARCSEGVLTLTLPKAEGAKPRQIKVKA